MPNRVSADQSVRQCAHWLRGRRLQKEKEKEEKEARQEVMVIDTRA
jgi:hypothetical protein